MTALAWCWDTIHAVNCLPEVLQIMETEKTLQEMNLSVSQGDIRLKSEIHKNIEVLLWILHLDTWISKTFSGYLEYVV